MVISTTQKADAKQRGYHWAESLRPGDRFLGASPAADAEPDIKYNSQLRTAFIDGALTFLERVKLVVDVDGRIVRIN